MADRKISDLTALTAPASGDYLPIVDISEAAAASKNKRITIEELFRGVPLGTAAAPSIAIEGDEDTGVYSPGANQLAISTGGSGRITIDGSGNVNIDSNTLYVDATNNRVGVGITSPAETLHLGGTSGQVMRINGVDTAAYFGAPASNIVQIASNRSPLTGTRVDGTRGASFINLNATTGGGSIDFATASGAADASTKATIDSSGRLLVGTSTARSNFFNGTSTTPQVQIEGVGSNVQSFLSQVRNSSADADAPVHIFAKSRGTALNSYTIVQSSDALGLLSFQGADGSEFVEAARIQAEVDGTPGANDMPGRLVFNTTADGAASPTERLRITSAGLVGIGVTAPSSRLTSRDTNETGIVSSLAIENYITGNPASGNGVAVDFNLNNNGNATGSMGRIAVVNTDYRDKSEMRFYTGTGATIQPRMVLDSSGRLGIGTTSPGQALEVAGSGVFTGGVAGQGAIIGRDGGTGGATYGCQSGDVLITTGNTNIRFTTSATERARIDSSGRLLVGTSSSAANALLTVSGYPGTSTGVGVFQIKRGSNATATDTDLGTIWFGDGLGDARATITAISDGAGGAGDLPTRLVFSTTKDGQSSPTEALRISSAQVTQVQTGGSNDNSLVFQVNSPSNTEPVRMYVSANGTPNAALATVRLQQNGTNNRSLNASGSVNANGADYAEYMLKSGDFTLAKGDICGIDNDGMLTNIYLDAISYVVKSTNPSYVGGDGIWGSAQEFGERPLDDEESAAEWDFMFEKERFKVDRIAFSGQVPVNVMGATPGQYIVPVEAADGGIEGIAKNEADLTLAEYMRAVGKVIAIEDDGRARIIVKVA